MEVTKTKQELFTELNELWTEFVSQHEGTTKKSQQLARKALSGLKKLVSMYNKASVQESKA